MAETKLVEKVVSSRIDELKHDLPEILAYVENKLKEGDKGTKIDIKALNDKICYATYGAEPLPFIYVLTKHILEIKDDALKMLNEKKEK
jgi:hypothetical protein